MSDDPTPNYVADPYAGLRRSTREVRVGDVLIGGTHPICIQSMTTTDTMDVRATVDQAEQLANAGSQLVRITAPSIRDAEMLREISSELRGRGVKAPLVADIHFTPNAAMIAAEFVEKVRVNPGNFADKKKFEVREYSEAQYAEELERVDAKFRPLVKRCKQNGVALRIGTNHGSLSDRIMNRYGDTPMGMVASALEFLDVCEDEGFLDVVFSMKASNTQVAIQAYRLLAERLEARAPGEPSYPFHVGVTEAGDGEDGRIKSAIGIGSLLEDGIGDTLRVSLTEDPVKELPVASALARRAEAAWAHNAASPRIEIGVSKAFVPDPYSHARRASDACSLGGLDVGRHAPPRVELDLGRAPPDDEACRALAAQIATAVALQPDLACEGLSVDVGGGDDLAHAAKLRAELRSLGVDAPVAHRLLLDEPASISSAAARAIVEVQGGASGDTLRAAAEAAAAAGVALEWCLRADLPEIPELAGVALKAARSAKVEELAFSVSHPRTVHAVRVLAARLRELSAESIPIVLRYKRRSDTPRDMALLEAAIELGAPLCDGIGDAVSLRGYGDPAVALDLAYRVLQGARLRSTRTEYISCPSCGRTLFDLEVTTARIKAKTEHLKGVKIAVMGCIVNGPGEMADADFGYVGSGPGRVNLYVEKEVIQRNVPEEEAPDRLVDLIRDHDRWVDPPSSGDDELP